MMNKQKIAYIMLSTVLMSCLCGIGMVLRENRPQKKDHYSIFFHFIFDNVTCIEKNENQNILDRRFLDQFGKKILNEKYEKILNDTDLNVKKYLVTGFGIEINTTKSEHIATFVELSVYNTTNYFSSKKVIYSSCEYITFGEFIENGNLPALFFEVKLFDTTDKIIFRKKSEDLVL